MKHTTLTIIVALNVFTLWVLYGFEATSSREATRDIYKRIEELRDAVSPRPYIVQQDDGTYRTSDGNYASPQPGGGWVTTLMHTMTDEQMSEINKQK